MKMNCLCFLKSSNEEHDPIALPHLEKIFVGRGPNTKITDTKCSRKQVELIADFEKKIVTLKQLGSNPGEVNGQLLEKGSTVEVKPGDSICILEGKYPYVIHFNSSTEERKVSPQKKKSNTKPSISDYFKGESNSKNNISEENEQTENRTKKRKLEENCAGKSSESKKVKSEKKQLDMSDSEEDDVEDIQQRLAAFQQNMKTLPTTSKTDSQPKSEQIGEENSSSVIRGSEAHQNEWQEFETIQFYTSQGVQASNKVAAFDIDNTIICTKSGRVFPTNPGDWRILYPEVPGNLKKLAASGYKIVFFTNQSGLGRKKHKIPDFKGKIEAIISKLGIPIQVFIATAAGGIYRKPGLGMWEHHQTKCNDGIDVDLKESFYIGDAAGRPVNWNPGKKKDFSYADRLFALNIDIKFQTPEEYFLGQKTSRFTMPEFDPKDVKAGTPLYEPQTASITSDSQEIIVCVGIPACGKSHFTKTYLLPKGYVHVSRDILKTWQKCVSSCEAALRQGKSVVIDNTNPDPESRNRYISCGESAGVPCRCFVFTTSLQHARHNERFRELTDKSHAPINDMILNAFKSKYVEPKLAEGFTEILKINCVPEFSSPEKEKIYRQYMLG